MHRAALAALVLALTALTATAQDQGFRVTKELDPPRGAESATLRDQARMRRVETGVTYATGLEGDLADGPAVRLDDDRETRTRTRTSFNGGSVPVLALIAILLVALALWLRFGGSGSLLAAAPKPDRKRHAAPDSWALSDEDRLADPRSLLDQIAAMPDRSAALVRLLRHCLLFAGEDSDTRFARADTEREAFRRLPEGWRFRQPLGALLRATELAHYGGRPVDDGTFAEALASGRQMLTQKGAGHA